MSSSLPGEPLEIQAEYFLRHVRDEENDAAMRWLERVPAIAGVNVFTAAAAGSDVTVLRLVTADPSLATATHSQSVFGALLYASASPIAADAPPLTHITRALLAAGADANTAYPGVGEGPRRGGEGAARAWCEDAGWRVHLPRRRAPPGQVSGSPARARAAARRAWLRSRVEHWYKEHPEQLAT